MIRNVWSVLCRDIITDQESNSVTYVRCIEEGAASSLPVSIGPVYLGTLWEKTGQEPESVRFRVNLVSPSRKNHALLNTKPLILDRSSHRLHFRLNALQLEEFGLYTIQVEFNPDEQWETAACLPVLIRKSQQ